MWECDDHEGMGSMLWTTPTTPEFCGVHGNNGLWLLRSHKIVDHAHFMATALFPIATNADEVSIFIAIQLHTHTHTHISRPPTHTLHTHLTPTHTHTPHTSHAHPHTHSTHISGPPTRTLHTHLTHISRTLHTHLTHLTLPVVEVQ